MAAEPTQLTQLTAAQIAAAVAAGEVSAVEVTQAHLDRIAAVDPDVHAFLHVAGIGALAAAEDVDRKRAAGEPLGPLAGVPLALKDVMTTARHADDLRIEDPRRLAAALRRDGHQAAARGRRHHPRQDQHGRVRDGLVHRELRLRPDPQPVGPRAGSPAARPAARPPRWPPTRRRWRSAPTPAARSASPRRSAASSA